MKSDQASRTAAYMALFRALETSRPSGERLFTDPLSFAFLKPSLRVVAGLARFLPLRRAIEGYIDRRWPGARTSGIARTRLIDDLLIAGLDDGLAQVVILGAGFDSRAYRLDRLKNITTFEIDHPATLATKRKLVQKYFGRFPANVTYLAIDFNRQKLSEALAASDFDPAAPTFFIWEGVTNYLTAEAVDSTLRFVGECAPGSRLVFTYVHQGVLDGTFTFAGSAEIKALLRRADEAWTFGLDPAELGDYLAARKLALLQDTGSVEYRAAYMGRAGKHLQGYEFYRVALTGVAPVTPTIVEAVPSAVKVPE